MSSTTNKKNINDLKMGKHLIIVPWEGVPKKCAWYLTLDICATS